MNITFFSKRQLQHFACAAFTVFLLSLSSKAEVTTATLKQDEARVRDIVLKSMPCTVALTPGGKQQESGSGSGVIVSEDGLILTAAHVSMKMNEKVTVIFPDGRKVTAKVLGMDYTRDSGMVQITDKGKYPYVEIGDSTALKQNDWCVALGHSGGFHADRTPPVRIGRVISNNPKKFLTTDSALIGGDSGGPLFDINGKLIGIHSNIGFSLSQNNHVPISSFQENWDRLKKGERYGSQEEGGLKANPDHPVIGAEIEDAPEKKGALIREVFFASPAKAAGLHAGDIIIKVGDSEIKDREAFLAEVGKHKVGDELHVTVKSNGKENEISIKLSTARLFSARRIIPAKSNRPEKEKKALQAEFEEKMRKSIEKGENQFSPDDLKKFSNPLEFKEFMDAFKKGLKPDELEKLAGIGWPTDKQVVRPGKFDPDSPIQVSDPFLREVLNGFHPVVARASDSTHLVFRGNDWKSLCTVVHEDGYVVTKASEIETKNNQALTVMLSKDRLVPAEIVKTFPKHDLALLKLKDTTGLTPLHWADSSNDLQLGSFISATGSGPDPIAIGVISVLQRSLASEGKGFLGIQTGPHKKGVLVNQVVPEGTASKAGIRPGDIITKIDNEVCDTPEKLTKKISSTPSGTVLILEYLRGQQESAARVKLGDRSVLDNRKGSQNRMGTEVSAQRTGYEQALQTDLPIRPEECGGPIVDLDGNVIAITISRAGRTRTYALPAEEVRQLLEPELKKLTQSAPVRSAD